MWAYPPHLVCLVEFVTMDEAESVDIDVEGSPPEDGVAVKEDKRALLQPRSGRNTEHYSWACLWDEIK